MIAQWLAFATLVATPQTGSAAVDDFIADIAADRRNAALARIYEMNSLTGEPNAVAFADEFVDKLLQCTFVSSQTSSIVVEMYDLRWRCPDGDYYSLLDPTWRPPQLVVGEFVSVAAREERRRSAMLAPPAPTPSANLPEPSDEEVTRIVTRYLDSVRRGRSASPGQITFRLRFLDRRRQDSQVGAEQLRRYLEPCRAAGEARPFRSRHGHGAIARWICTGPNSLDTNLTTMMNVYDGRVVSGQVLVGQLPNDGQGPI